MRARHVGEVAKQEKHHETTRFHPVNRGSRRSIRPSRGGGGRHRADPRHGPAPRRRGHPGTGRQLAHGELREANQLAREAGKPQPRPDPPDDEKNYWAEAIRIGDSYFYRVGDIVVPATEYEYRMVIANPNMYYFSSALKLHYRIQRKRDGVPEPV